MEQARQVVICFAVLKQSRNFDYAQEKETNIYLAHLFCKA